MHRVLHRFEVLHHERQMDQEAWRNRDGSIQFLRKRGSRLWQALLGGRPVVDADRLNGGYGGEGVTAAEALLQCVSPRDLARSLAQVEHIHLVFD